MNLKSLEWLLVGFAVAVAMCLCAYWGARHATTRVVEIQVSPDGETLFTFDQAMEFAKTYAKETQGRVEKQYKARIRELEAKTASPAE